MLGGKGQRTSPLCEFFFPNRTHSQVNGQRLYFSTPKHSSTLFIQPFTQRFLFFCTLLLSVLFAFHKTANEFLPGNWTNSGRDRSASITARDYFLVFCGREREKGRERDLMLLMLLCHCQQFPQNRCKEHKITRAFHQCRFYPSSVSRSCSACHFVCVLHLCEQERYATFIVFDRVGNWNHCTFRFISCCVARFCFVFYFFILDPGCYCNSILVDEKCSAGISSTCLLV